MKRKACKKPQCDNIGQLGVLYSYSYSDEPITVKVTGEYNDIEVLLGFIRTFNAIKKKKQETI